MFGLDPATGGAVAVFFLFIVAGFILPFIINPFLARSRGKSVLLMLLLTLIFSWIVTLILAFMPKAERPSKVA